MQLALSSAAAPQLTLAALDAACRARGLAGEELVLAEGEDAEAVSSAASASGARIVALRTYALNTQNAPGLARASARLEVPVSIPTQLAAQPSLAALLPIFEQTGGRLLLDHGTNLDQTLALIEDINTLRSKGSLGLAWQIRPGAESLEEASAVLFAAREYLGLVRLYGGGPEQSDQDGLGLGPLLVDLALSGYAAPIVLCPSRSEELPRWHKWLGSTRSAGCGHRVEGRKTLVDVRDVEPKDRLDTILSAYRSLSPGAVLQLTVDHDPSCMYYTLEATEPQGSFTFQTTEHGPEVWRAEVTKL